MASLTTLHQSPQERAGLGRVARGGVLNLAGAGYAGLAGFGITWLAAHGLAPHEAGLFFAATAAFALAVTVAKLGTQTGLVYWPARLRNLDRKELLGSCLRVALIPVVIVSLVLGAGLWATGRYGALMLFIPLAALTDSLLATTRGCRRSGPTVLLDKIVRPSLQLLALGLAIWLARGVTPAFLLAWAWAYLPVCLLSAKAAASAIRATHQSGADPAVRPEDLQPRVDLDNRGIGHSFWKFTAPRAVSSVVQQALQRVDVMLLAALVGLTQAAYYAVAGRFIILGQLANQALAYSVQPRIAELLAAGDRPATKALYQSATAWLVLLSWPVYLLSAIFAPVYLRLFGGEYSSASNVVVILALAMMVASGCGMVDSVLSMAGRTSWNLINVAVALGLNIGVDLLLIPHWGAVGAACGSAVAVLTNNLLPLAQLHWGLGLHPFGHGTGVAALLAICCFGGFPLLAMALLGRGVPGLSVALGVSTGLYGLGCWRCRTPLALSALSDLRPGKSTRPTALEP